MLTKIDLNDRLLSCYLFKRFLAKTYFLINYLVKIKNYLVQD